MWGIHRSPVNSPHKCQWRGALMLSLICVGLNGWINNREAGDLRRYGTHYDVTVMVSMVPASDCPYKPCSWGQRWDPPGSYRPQVGPTVAHMNTAIWQANILLVHHFTRKPSDLKEKQECAVTHDNRYSPVSQSGIPKYKWPKSSPFLTLWPWPLTHALEKFINSGYNYYKCVKFRNLKTIQLILSNRVHTI